MTSGKRSKQMRYSKAAMLEQTQRKPMGYFLVQDHGFNVSCLQYFTQTEKDEIERMAADAQTACKANPKHAIKGGLCCLLMVADEQTWKAYH